MKGDLVNRFTRSQAAKGINKTECAKKLTQLCGGSTRVQEVWRMEQAERKPSPCKHFVMLNATLDETLKEFGYTRPRPLSSVKWVELIQALLPPERKK